MASVPPVPAPVECAGARMHECSVLSCAWKAPRALTGSLASTARGHCAAQDAWRRWRCWSYAKPSSTRLEVLRIDHHRFLGAVCSFACGDHLRPNAHSVSRGYWNLYCKLSDSEPSDALSSESLWQDLKPVISYLPPEELDLVHRALKLAYEAHHGQKRRSGEPFIIHPVEVARILGELEVDWESVAAGLLHDTVEDTNKVTFEKIEKEFGVSVRNIVEGETKVSKLGKLKYTDSDGSKQDVKADDLRQMFLAMTEEVRVIIVKLADRLHNMRTLSHMPTDKQSSIAMETLQVFAPLAKLLGMYQIKAELESWSFMYTNPEDFSNIKKRVEDLYKEHEKELAEAKKFLKQKIEDDQFLQLLALKTEVHSVCKEPYSVYKAMLKSKSKIDEISLVAQICIVLQTKNCSGVGPLCNAQQICYHVLGLVHGLWTPIPTTMKDFIATPKQNGYQGLHTIVIPFLNESMFRVEVLIRTEDMDLIAQRGIAAHYTGRTVSESGKGRTYERILRTKPVRLNNADFALRISWLNAIREWQEEFVGNMTSREFVDTVLRDLLGSRVFVFTPKGEIKNLPRGATVIDYAYLIHTEVGNKMVAAKVNGNGVPLMHVLANAEVVEIITYDSLSSKSAFQRHQQWLQHAKTRSARHKIMKFLREQAGKSATEITADTVNNFVGDLIEENEDENFPVSPPKDNLFVRRQIILPMISNEELSPVMNSVAPSRKNKGTQDMVIKVNGHRKTGFYSSLPELENWKESKIVSWHSLGGHSIQWFCVVCIDRRGMMADVTSSLTAAGITICSCSAEKLDMGMGVMLFRIEGTSENLVNACSSIESIPGVGWSTGCSLYDLSETHKYI